MNILRKTLMAGGCAALLALGTNNAMSQPPGGGGGGGRRGGGNYDPVAMKQRMMDDMKDQWEIKDDAEWSAIEPKLSKVIDARAELMASTMRGAFGRGGNNRRGGNGGGGGAPADDNGGGGRQRGGPGGMGAQSPAVEALQKAIDDKAPKDEIKTKLKAVQDEKKDKEAKMVAAQEDLRALLNTRQEAIATLRGLL